MFVNRSGHNEQSLERTTFHRCFLPSFTSFGRGVSEEKIKMWKDNGWGCGSMKIWSAPCISTNFEWPTFTYKNILNMRTKILSQKWGKINKKFVWLKVASVNISRNTAPDWADLYRSASQSDWYFILATGLKLRSIFRTVTFRQVQLKIYFELQYFIPLLKSDK
jgi:hypothetical protein